MAGSVEPTARVNCIAHKRTYGHDHRQADTPKCKEHFFHSDQPRLPSKLDSTTSQYHRNVQMRSKPHFEQVFPGAIIRRRLVIFSGRRLTKGSWQRSQRMK